MVSVISQEKGKKRVRKKTATKTKTQKTSSTKKSGSYWPKPYPVKDLEIYNFSELEPSKSRVQRFSKQLSEKYKKKSNMFIIDKVIKKFKSEDLNGWTEKTLKSYILNLFWTRQVGSVIKIKKPDILDINKAILKYIIEKKKVTNFKSAVNTIYERLEGDVKEIEGYAIHKNPLYSKKDIPSRDSNDKYYNELKEIIMDRLKLQILIMSSYKKDKNLLKYL